MRKIIRQGFPLVVLCGMWIGTSVAAEELSLPKEAQEMLVKASQVKSYRVRFALEAKEEDGKPVRMEGVLLYAQPNRRRLELKTPESEESSQLVVSDGTTEWQYYSGTHTAYRLESSPMAPGPHRAFAEMQEGTVRFIEKRSEGDTALLRFEATPLSAVVEGSPVPIETLQVDVREADGLVQRLVLLGQKGDTVLMQQYQDLELNPSVSEETFHFTPPEGTQVVEMGARLNGDKKGEKI